MANDRPAVNPVARTGKPRSTTAAASIAAAVVAYLATDKGSGLLAEAIVFVATAGVGTLIPSLRLTDPATRAALNTDSSISSVLLSVATALAAAIASGQLPLPDSARGMLVALLAGIAGIQFPAVNGTALAGLRGRRGTVREVP
jgi:hypothetical protein